MPVTPHADFCQILVKLAGLLLYLPVDRCAVLLAELWRSTLPVQVSENKLRKSYVKLLTLPTSLLRSSLFGNLGVEFLEAFALNRPVIPLMGQRHEINAGIAASQVQFARKLLPEPNMFEPVGIFGVGLQISLHKALKAIAFVALRESNFAVMGEYFLKTHGCIRIRPEVVSHLSAK